MAKKEKAAAAEATAAPAAAPAPKKEKAPKVEQNGVTRPTSGSTARVWAIADELSSKKGEPVERKEVSEVGEKEGLNVGTIHTQYGRWRKFHGLSTPKAEKTAEAAPAATGETAAA